MNAGACGDRAAVCVVRGLEEFEQRGLAGAVGADQADLVSGMDFETDVLEDVQGPIRLGNVVEADQQLVLGRFFQRLSEKDLDSPVELSIRGLWRVFRQVERVDGGCDRHFDGGDDASLLYFRARWAVILSHRQQ